MQYYKAFEYEMNLPCHTISSESVGHDIGYSTVNKANTWNQLNHFQLIHLSKNSKVQKEIERDNKLSCSAQIKFILFPHRLKGVSDVVL